MIIIKKYLMILLLILLALTGCNSKKNIETVVANSTAPTTERELSTQPVTEASTEQVTTKEVETEITTETTETTTKETETTTKTVETTTKPVETTTKPIETTTKPVETTTETMTEDNTEIIDNTESEDSTEINTIAEETTNPTVNNTNYGNISSNESNKSISWSFQRNKDHSRVVGYNQGVDIKKFDAYYIGDSSRNVIYLTFDEGYEYGYTPSILDTLKDNNVKATFFLTKAFMKSEPELTKRMAREGHIVANHTVNHPNMPDLSDEEIKYEIEETARYYKELTGYEMDKFIRPPAGVFSARTLDITKQLGYKTIFWSLAYLDWDVNNQPGKDVAYQHVMDNYHNGGIFLLHAVSKSNTEALDDMLKSLKDKGYSFGSLYDLN